MIALPVDPAHPHTVDELVRAVTERMRAPELLSEDPQQEARELVAHALGTIPEQLGPRARQEVSAHHRGELLRLLARRLAPEPTGYIVGAVEILGTRFKVDRRGFIPRLDLPVLIGAGLEGVPEAAQGRALDLACGIGAAGICVARARPGLLLDLADVSAEAIELARENASLLLPGRAEALAGERARSQNRFPSPAGPRGGLRGRPLRRVARGPQGHLPGDHGEPPLGARR